MLNTADAMARIQLPRSERLNLEIASRAGAPILITGGIEIRPHRTLQDNSATDLVILPAMRGNPHPTINAGTIYYQVAADTSVHEHPGVRHRQRAAPTPAADSV